LYSEKLLKIDRGTVVLFQNKFEKLVHPFGLIIIIIIIAAAQLLLVVTVVTISRSLCPLLAITGSHLMTRRGNENATKHTAL